MVIQENVIGKTVRAKKQENKQYKKQTNYLIINDYIYSMAKKKSKGLGDTISKVTKTLGIKECKGCEDRKDLLNKLVPYKRDMKETELQDWYSYLSKEDKTYDAEEQEYIMSVLRIVNGINLKSSVGCDSSCWDGWIEKVNVELNKTK